ncbi:MAG: hypothetical protein JRD94_15355, partial [Deltaproteobacteria bacterium]|nr:hypothetical protein [Deltaproteobacteria bacterium]
MSISTAASRLQMAGPAGERIASRSTIKVFWTCTALVWAGVGVCAGLFYVGVLEFTTSASSHLGATGSVSNGSANLLRFPRRVIDGPGQGGPKVPRVLGLSGRRVEGFRAEVSQGLIGTWQPGFVGPFLGKHQRH